MLVGPYRGAHGQRKEDTGGGAAAAGAKGCQLVRTAVYGSPSDYKIEQEVVCEWHGWKRAVAG